MNDIKVITLCGSLKFQKEIMLAAEKLSREGYCVLTPVYPTNSDIKRTQEELEKLKLAHLKKIELSDAIYVVNVNNYIGFSTNLEIEYAKKLNKEIIYYNNK